MVVEDDPDVREVLTEFLRDDGYDVVAAANGLEALDLLRREGPPSLILLDLTMPVFSGADFRARQMADPRLSEIPVVVLTGRDCERLDIQALQGCHVARKPIDAWELMATIESATSRGNPRERASSLA